MKMDSDTPQLRASHRLIRRIKKINKRSHERERRTDNAQKKALLIHAYSHSYSSHATHMRTDTTHATCVLVLAQLPFPIRNSKFS